MTSQQYQQAATAETNNLGQCTFTFPYPTASDRAAQGTLQVDAGPSGVFTVSDSTGVTWGTWNGSQPFGPITIQGNVQLTISATGLLPLTQYVAQFIGASDLTANIDASMPSPTGVTGLFGTDVMVELEAITVTSTATFLGSFPTSVFGGMRIGANLAAGGPVTILLTWSTADGTQVMGTQTFIVGGPSPAAGNKLSRALPHLGDQLEISLSAPISSPATFSFSATHCSAPLAAWGGLDLYQTAALVAKSSSLALNPANIYGGPAHVDLDPGGAPNWWLVVQAEDGAGNTPNIIFRSNADVNAGGRIGVDFQCPARPITVTGYNTSTTTGYTMDLSLAYDLSRVG
jgi:hypothetical protein